MSHITNMSAGKVGKALQEKANSTVESSTIKPDDITLLRGVISHLSVVGAPTKIEMEQIQCQEHGPFLGAVCYFANGNVTHDDCPKCLIDQERQMRADREDALRAARNKIEEVETKRLVEKTGIPKIFQNKKFQDWERKTPEALEIWNTMGRLYKNFDSSDGESYIYTGRSRTGKSHLANALMINLARAGKTVLYTSAIAMVRDVKRAWAGEGSEDSLINRYVEPDILTVDEVLRVPMDVKERGMFFDVVDRRYLAGKNSLFLTNATEKELLSQLGEETVNRMINNGKVLPFDWEPHPR